MASLSRATTHDAEDRGDNDAGQPNWLLADDRRGTALSEFLPERWRGARVDPGRKGMLALSGVGLVVVLVAAYGWLRDAPAVAPVPALPVVQPVSDDATSTTVATSGVVEPAVDLVVSVVGLVVHAGLVHLPAGSRVADALAAAGGAREGADVIALNLAAKVADGDQIVVGALPPDGRPVVSGTTSDAAVQSNSTSDAAGGGSGPVNLNDATVAELDSLPGVGPVTAANIVAWRDVNGPFTDVEQLSEVDGIGPVRLEKLRDQVSV
ncbi:ComEA family DNA-binding protein [Rhodococcoides kyotonense]|uniref:Competence protein ComEA n=1 Tax=Rhodococcoides kyotonense TaxID=398843 RepID=A0A239HH78_9NOCA|nr:helix-hairpin-helix domain-containing protein [Rhodococcus kyotonensis]SNS80776.1 competence protein ComEA [Rhodococcus kyotonensis]